MSSDKRHKALSDLIELIYSHIHNNISGILPSWIDDFHFVVQQHEITLWVQEKSTPSVEERFNFEKEFNELAGTPCHINYYTRKKKSRAAKIQQKSSASFEFFEEQIEASLPTNIELTKLWLYKMRLPEDSFRLLLCRVICDESQHDELLAWKHAFEEQHKNVHIVLNRDWARDAILRILDDSFPKETIILKQSDRKTLGELIKKHFGIRHNRNYPKVSAWLDTSKLIDYTDKSFCWFAVDPEGVRDIEDLMCAKLTKNGLLELYIAIADPSEYVSPGCKADVYAEKVGANIYARFSTLTTLPYKIAHDKASFLLEKKRRAFVAKYTFSQLSGELIGNHPEFTWGIVKNHASIAPEDVAHWLNVKHVSNEYRNGKQLPGSYPLHSLQIKRSLKLFADGLPHLRNHLRGVSATHESFGLTREYPLTRGHLMVNIAMVTFCADLSEEFERNNLPYIARNQMYPGTEYLEDLSERLKAASVPLTGEAFVTAEGLTQLLDYLDNNRLFKLHDEIIRKFLLKTTLSTKSRGFGPIKRKYMRIKSRFFDGLTNAMTLAAHLSGGETPFSEAELERRTRVASRKQNALPSNGYVFRALNAMHKHLKNVGKKFKAEIKRLHFDEKSSFYILDVPGFSHMCIAEKKEDDKTLKRQTKLEVVFDGIQIRNRNVYCFSITRIL